MWACSHQQPGNGHACSDAFHSYQPVTVLFAPFMSTERAICSRPANCGRVLRHTCRVRKVLGGTAEPDARKATSRPPASTRPLGRPTLERQPAGQVGGEDPA